MLSCRDWSISVNILRLAFFPEDLKLGLKDTARQSYQISSYCAFTTRQKHSRNRNNPSSAPVFQLEKTAAPGRWKGINRVFSSLLQWKNGTTHSHNERIPPRLTFSKQSPCTMYKWSGVGLSTNRRQHIALAILSKSHDSQIKPNRFGW